MTDMRVYLAEKWTKIRPYILPGLIFAAPILVVWLARFIFEDIIEVGRIDVGFLPGSETRALYPVTFIPARVISSLYNFGFALCAAMVFAVALATYGSVVVWMAALSRWLKAGYLLMLLMAFVLVASNFSKISLTDDHIFSKIGLADNHIPTEISRNLIDKTLYYLPTCEGKELPILPACTSGDIGNTGNSLKRVVALGIAVLLVAGLAYLTAIAVVAGSTAVSVEDRIARIKNITLLAAITFLLTIVAVHLLFQPGADMIAAAYHPKKPEEIGQLQDYGSLRGAMTLYWATIFSLALGTAYFCSVTFVQGEANKLVDFGSIWNVVKALLTVMSPLIADWVLKIGEIFAGVLGTQ